MGLCEQTIDMIRDHETRATRVLVDPVYGDVIFNLPDRSGLSVPKPVWAEYCRRVRPLRINGDV